MRINVQGHCALTYRASSISDRCWISPFEIAKISNLRKLAGWLVERTGRTGASPNSPLQTLSSRLTWWYKRILSTARTIRQFRWTCQVRILREEPLRRCTVLLFWHAAFNHSPHQCFWWENSIWNYSMMWAVARWVYRGQVLGRSLLRNDYNEKISESFAAEQNCLETAIRYLMSCSLVEEGSRREIWWLLI